MLPGQWKKQAPPLSACAANNKNFARTMGRLMDPNSSLFLSSGNGSTYNTITGGFGGGICIPPPVPSPLFLHLNQEALNRNVRVMRNVIKDLKTCKGSASKSTEHLGGGSSKDAPGTKSGGTFKSTSLRHKKAVHTSSHEFSTTLEMIRGRKNPKRKDTPDLRPEKSSACRDYLSSS